MSLKSQDSKVWFKRASISLISGIVLVGVHWAKANVFLGIVGAIVLAASAYSFYQFYRTQE
jgi:hypothetical protein